MSAGHPGGPGDRYDAIVVGLGSMGSAAAYHLARRGARVLGLEQFDFVHEQGSMHGLSRIIRLAYHEHPDYVPLLRRAYELWYELEDSEEPLLTVTGQLAIGSPEGPLIAGALLACREHDLPFELLDGDAVRERFPQFAPEPGSVAIYQPEGGFLDPERSVRAHLDAALAAGAELRSGERVLDWTAAADGVRVRTDRASYEAGRLVLAPGAWAPALLHLPPELFAVERQVVAWFEPLDPEPFTPDRMPIFFVETGGEDHYGFPNIDGVGVKLGRMGFPGQPVGDPEAMDRTPGEAEIEVLRAFLAEHVPAAAGALTKAGVCMFTNTPDGHFLLDLHPTEPNVVVASACSGHGFKFASVVGEILAELALDGDTRHPIDFLRYDRLTGIPA
ncbi:MAG TPA: N-methyl-L-tryptophan oxidase [Gaiellaceae bacterium]